MYLSFIDALLQAEQFNIFIRLVLAILLATGIGLSKELFVRPSGFRVCIISAIASCLLTLLGYYQFKEDVGIIIASIIVTTGLITLGIINNNRGEYLGIVNACMVIVASVIGVTCGAGMLFAAVCTTLLTVLAMFVLRLVEKSLITTGYILNIVIDSRTPVLKELLYIFDHNHLTTSSIESKIVLFDRKECVKIRVEFVRATNKIDIERVMPIIKDQISPLSITLRNDTYGVVK